MATTADKVFTWEEVVQHNSKSAGVWVVIRDYVYDVTQFLDEVSWRVIHVCVCVCVIHSVSLASIPEERRCC